MLPLLRCSRDGNPIALQNGAHRGASGIIDATLHCHRCGAKYPIQGGVARMLVDDLAPEDEHEIAIRDREHFYTSTGPFIPPTFGWRSNLSDRLEIPPHLAALGPLNNQMAMELGCGDGRFTMLMAGLGARVLAVDFSISALRQMAHRLPSGFAPTSYRIKGPFVGADLRGRIALVQADINHFRIAPRSFTRALSATPLDSRDQRMAMYRTIADALADDGRFVGGVEHDDLLRRMLGLPIARRYSKGGIFIEHFDAATMRREAAPYFHKLHVRPIRPSFPFAARLPATVSIGVSLAAAYVPFLRQLGELLLLRAERPVRPPLEGENRPGSNLVRGLFRWYTRKLGKHSVWGSDEHV